jgi:hypothetical protein
MITTPEPVTIGQVGEALAAARIRAVALGTIVHEQALTNGHGLGIACDLLGRHVGGRIELVGQAFAADGLEAAALPADMGDWAEVEAARVAEIAALQANLDEVGAANRAAAATILAARETQAVLSEALENEARQNPDACRIPAPDSLRRLTRRWQGAAP